ncbi:YjiH family protein [Chungangia koreensis]|uniref:YjiH family protein n=1 Tax=Chungangia koreensis TaxID=752657 RepID=A0ABV8X609_9LACT
MKKFSPSTWLIFLLPSIIGILLFMIPLPTEEGWKIPVAMLANWVAGYVEPIMPWTVTIVLVITAILTLAMKFIRSNDTHSFIGNLFNVNWFWTIVRVLGAIFALMVVLQFGPESFWNENTGGLLLAPDGLVSFLFTIFLFAGLFLPFLLNFGLLEFFGSMMVKIMRPLFKLPGRSSIDALASWIGDGTIGVLLTSKQYEDGFYTKKEAAIVGTTFSIVSITFAVVVIEEMNLSQYFLPYYGTVVLAGFVLALIMPRIYPLSRKTEEYIDGRPIDKNAEELPEGYNVVSHGVEKALEKASSVGSFGQVLKSGLKNVIDMWVFIPPVVMAFGTVTLVIAEYTPFFKWLGSPFIPILTVLGVPEAAEAAQTMVVGFADMFLPAILGSGIESEFTRFVIATMSVTQLIYMSEVGGLLLGSKIPVNFKDLIIIFLLRTIISLPIIVGVAHLIF